MRKAPSAETYKLLYVRSGNECAFSGCHHPIFNDDGTYIAQLCHITAANKGGPRYDSSQSDEDRRAIENLLFMCHRHHKETDDTSKFKDSDMEKMKHRHESQFTEKGKALSDKMLEQIDLDSRYYWNQQRNKIFFLDELKMKTNLDIDEVKLYTEVEEAIELIFDYCTTCAHSDNSTTISSDLKKIIRLSWT